MVTIVSGAGDSFNNGSVVETDLSQLIDRRFHII